MVRLSALLIVVAFAAALAAVVAKAVELWMG